MYKINFLFFPYGKSRSLRGWLVG